MVIDLRVTHMAEQAVTAALKANKRLDQVSGLQRRSHARVKRLGDRLFTPRTAVTFAVISLQGLEHEMQGQHGGSHTEYRHARHCHAFRITVRLSYGYEVSPPDPDGKVFQACWECPHAI